MEYRNNSFGIYKILKSIISLIIGIFIFLLILKGIFILIPIGIVAWFGYKGVKYIRNKLSKIKTKDEKHSYNIHVDKINENDVDDIFNSESVIDVNYKEVK